MERAVRLTAVVTHEGDWYVARALEVEVTSQGPSVEESLANLREALELYFEDEPIPAASVDGPIVAPVDIRLSA
ncbi:type II toxin-antitoxin system HicB family antitoxin [Frankia canadensis]|nr:type II toxin-antitoxin system HicB family antitoxin [Frankia canadensis]